MLTICRTRTFGASWGTDNRIILGSFGGLRPLRVSADGGTAEPLKLLGGNAQASPSWPEILPGGKVVLFTAVAAGASEGTIVAQKPDTGESKVLLEGGTFPDYVSTGHLVYYRLGNLMAVPFDPDRLEVLGTPIPILEGIRSVGNLRASAQFAISRSGNKMMVVSVNADSDFAAGNPKVLFEGDYLLTAFSFPYYDVSPDGKRFLMLEPVASEARPPAQINIVLNGSQELKRLVPR